ncbi:Vacuolar ATP synthase 16 kDa proteolipid subunit [Carpediemonas membranifera]|uniref:Vacuolar ATP synthase 16 kDa proteolipid subunit n=1 Tax=Carpediemonas membranifera TaxID=201153 RepID=A0A8J6DZ82_9EUKA|nr:Vacuolar ATP synthase 16 kDa proteolipid subunit [Carpediemonas membranifera]|eukprot:KAG9393279.1 Vacuolar ATP synthase 16 kDa proteolipid subunit [Carpediemonas membranifera]
MPNLIDECMTWIESIDIVFWGSLGPAFSISLCILGAAWGIWSTGSTLIGACIRKREIWVKNLISILLCEAIAIYGVIETIFLITHIKYQADEEYNLNIRRTMYGYLASGLGTGIGCASAGAAVGILGGYVAISDAWNRHLFIKCFIVEVFAEAIGVMALIVGIVSAASA